MTYSNLSPEFKALITSLDMVTVPSNIHVAMETPEWKAAIIEEMRALEKNETWEQVALPEGHKTVGCKWVFTVKYKSDGSIDRYKARLVAKGFTQTFGIDYSETLSPVAKLIRFGCCYLLLLIKIGLRTNWM
ncbi:uncharacterized mitochondrial protein AtMg00820-like [Benincasa hispida]|uniref:uncharacterized mitochondrial protein AtMg00820-like n=1 Tax=Benincasa hispida TaxID=102211 RepID=UPI0019018D21|nr:uncharacterized mitochondrial protein AtMg00820-like [Benincasa hispida]